MRPTLSFRLGYRIWEQPQPHLRRSLSSPPSPASYFRGPGRWGIRWIEDVDIYRDIDIRITDSRLQLLNNARHAHLVYVASCNDLKSTSFVITPIKFLVRDRGSNPSVNGRIQNQTLLVREMQKRPMIDAGVVADPPAQYLRIPRVEVAVEVDHTDWSPVLIRRAQRRQRGGVVAPQRDDSRRAGDVGGICGPRGDGLVGVEQLVQCERVVQEGQGRVATVDDFRPGLEAVLVRVSAPAEGEGHAAGALSNPAGAEARAGTAGGASVEGGAEEGDVIFEGWVGGEAVRPGEVGEGGEAGVFVESH
jgi:hypothetical protein